MALERKYQKIFGKNAEVTDLGIVGSKNAGSPDTSNDVEELQSLSNWETGLRAQVTTSEAPYLQDQNSIFYVITSQLAYLFQAGIAEWNSQTEYFAYKSLVSYNGKIFVSVQDSTNKNPSSEGAYWLEYCQLFIKYLPTTYNIDVATAIGGYPLGAILYYTDSSDNTFKIQSLINNNTNEPSASNIQFENSGEGTYYWKALPLRPTNESIVIKTYINGTDWYRLYSDGWVEQGGQATANSARNFVTPFANTDYTLVGSQNNTSQNESIQFHNKSTTGFTIRSARSVNCCWYASGKGA